MELACKEDSIQEEHWKKEMGLAYTEGGDYGRAGLSKQQVQPCPLTITIPIVYALLASPNSGAIKQVGQPC